MVANAVGALLAGGLTVGCTTHQCDATSETFGAGEGGVGTWELIGCGGTLSDCLLRWQSGPTIGIWPAFPHNVTATFTFPPAPVPSGMYADFTQADPVVYVSFDPPASLGADANFINATGNLAEFGAISEKSISVFNGTCAGGTVDEPSYWVRVTMTVPVLPLADDAGIVEAGVSDATNE